MLSKVKKITYKLVLFTFIFGELFYIPAYASTNIAISNKQKHLVNTGKSKQGVNVVNIKTPNSSGLSHNIFNSFEVNESGVIFNNSAEDTNTTIGGEVNANTNLTKGEEASIILGEVKSKLASNISGFMEVAGLKSDLIISNLNGINCNGCGFINVNRGVLTTGLPLIDEQGRLQSFTANSGSITIGKNGLNAKGAESLEIISPLLNLNGYIEGNDTSIILGGSVYNYNTKKAEKTSTNLESYPENVNSVISSSNFGGIYGSRIRLVNLEDKIGLQVDFKIKAENENIEIESKNLNIKEQGSLEANNNINIKAEQISNSGEILAQNELTIKGNSLNSYNTLSGYNVYLYTDSFINNEGANLNAFNNIYITGLNGQNASYVGNISANIKANNNIDIFTNTFENKLAWYDFKIAYGNWVQTKYYYLNSHTWNEGIKRRYREDRFYVQRHRNITYDFEGALSSDFYAGGNINIQAESIFNQNSSIKALGDINLNANVVQNINEHKEGYKEEEFYTHRVVHYYKRDWIGKWQYEGIAYTKNTDFKHLGNTVNSFTQGTNASIIADGLINITTNYLQNGQEYAGIRAEYIDSNVIQGSNININASGSVVNNGLFKAEDGIDIFASGSVVNNGHMVTEDKTNIHANTIESYENERDALITSSENLASEMEDLAKQINKYKGKIYSLENKYLNQYDILANKFNLRMERLLFIDDELIALYRGDKILTNINIEAESITGKGGYFASDIINFGTDDLDLKAHEIQTYVHVKPSVIYKNKDTGKVCNESNKIECYSKVTIEQEGANGKGTTTIIDYNSIVVDSLIDNNYSYTSNLESFKLEARYLANFDVENNFTLSSSIIETPSLNINANNVVITAQSEKSFNTTLKNNLLFDEKETNIIASSITSGSVNINTEGNFILQGSKLEAGSLKVNSQDNIIISHLNNYNSWSYNALGGYQEYGSSTSIAESNIIAGSIDFTSGNNASIIASSVFGQNDVKLVSGGFVNIAGDYNTYFKNATTITKDKGFLKTTIVEETTQEQGKNAVGSFLGSNGEINIVSASDITILGSQVYSIKETNEEGNNVENDLVNNVNLYAGYKVQKDGFLSQTDDNASLIIANMEDSYIKNVNTKTTKKGLQSGWYKNAMANMYDWGNIKETGFLSFKIHTGSKRVENTTTKETIVASSNIRSDGELNLNAEHVAITGSNLTSEQDTNIKANSITILDAKNIFEHSHSFKQKDIYATAEFGNAFVDLGYSAKNSYDANKDFYSATKKANKAKKDYENGLISEKAYNDIMANLVATGANSATAFLNYASSASALMQGAATFGFYANLGLSEEINTGSSYSYNTQSVGSSLSSLASININTGALESVGTNFIAKQDINIKASDKISIKAGQNTSYTKKESGFISSSVNTRLDDKGLYQANANALGLSSQTQLESSAVYYNNSQINAEGNIAIQAQNNIELEGVNVEGFQVLVESKEAGVTLASVQDTSSYESKGSNNNFSFGVNNKNSSIGVGQNTASANSKEVTENSSIIGKDKVVIKAGENLELLGSLVANAKYDEENKKLIDEGNLYIEAENIIANNLENKTKEQNQGYNFGFNHTGQEWGGFNNINIALVNKEKTQEGATFATIGKGTVSEKATNTITENDDKIASINRDISKLEAEKKEYVASDLDLNLSLDTRLIGLNGGYNSIAGDIAANIELATYSGNLIYDYSRIYYASYISESYKNKTLNNIAMQSTQGSEFRALNDYLGDEKELGKNPPVYINNPFHPEKTGTTITLEVGDGVYDYVGEDPSAWAEGSHYTGLVSEGYIKMATEQVEATKRNILNDNDNMFLISYFRWNNWDDETRESAIDKLGKSQLKALNFTSTESYFSYSVILNHEDGQPPYPDTKTNGYYDHKDNIITINSSSSYIDNYVNKDSFIAAYEVLTHEIIHKVQYEGIAKGKDADFVGSNHITESDRIIISCNFSDPCRKRNYKPNIKEDMSELEKSHEEGRAYKTSPIEAHAFFVGDSIKYYIENTYSNQDSQTLQKRYNEVEKNSDNYKHFFNNNNEELYD